jgi:endonuclease YncB( thermonuclease family)
MSRQEAKPELTPAFRYKAQVVSVYDGDTVHLLVFVKDTAEELGLYLTLKQQLLLKAKIRLDALNAPEMNTTAGKASAAYLQKMLPAGMMIEMEVSKSPLDKYGRYVAVLYLQDGTNVNQTLIDKGYAEQREYLPRTVI